MTRANESNGYEAVGKTVLFVVMLAFASVVNGLVLTRLWAWFIADTFGVQDLSVAQAVGFALVARFLMSPPVEASNRKSFGVLLAEGFGRIVGTNGLTLLLGLVVVQFT